MGGPKQFLLLSSLDSYILTITHTVFTSMNDTKLAEYRPSLGVNVSGGPNRELPHLRPKLSHDFVFFQKNYKKT